MKRELTVQFPAAQISQNDRLHWARKAELTGLWRSAACWHGLATKWTALPPSTVQFAFTGVMVRDGDALAPTEKAVIDGLVDAGFWPDDSTGWIAKLPTVIVRGRWPLSARTVTITIRDRKDD